MGLKCELREPPGIRLKKINACRNEDRDAVLHQVCRSTGWAPEAELCSIEPGMAAGARAKSRNALPPSLALCALRRSNVAFSVSSRPGPHAGDPATGRVRRRVSRGRA